MTSPVTKVFPVVVVNEEDCAACKAIQLTPTEAGSLTQPAPKPAQK